MLLARVQVSKKLISISLLAYSGKYDFIGQGDDTIVPGFLRLSIWDEFVNNPGKNNVRIYNVASLLGELCIFFVVAFFKVTKNAKECQSYFLISLNLTLRFFFSSRFARY